MAKWLVTAVLVMAAGSAYADDTGVYAGVGAVQSKILDIYRLTEKYPLYGVPHDIFHLADTSWRVFLGYRPTKPFAVEVGYASFGSNRYFWNNGFLSFSGHALTAYGVGFVPLPLQSVELYGKVGLDHWTLDSDIYFRGPRSDQANQLAWGAGVQAHVRRVGVRLEYERLVMVQVNRAYLYSLGLTWAF